MTMSYVHEAELGLNLFSVLNDKWRLFWLIRMSVVVWWTSAIIMITDSWFSLLLHIVYSGTVLRQKSEWWEEILKTKRLNPVFS